MIATATKPAPIAADAPILARIGRDLGAVYRDRLDRAILFGSRARGDARPESDYDVLVVLRRHEGVWAEAQRLGGVAAGILDDTGAVVSFVSMPIEKFGARTAFMTEIGIDGVPL